MMQIVLTIIAFGTTIAAIFGYQAIKSGAETKAVEVAEKFLKDNGQELIQREFDRRTVVASVPTYSIQRAEQDIQNSTPAEEGGI